MIEVYPIGLGILFWLVQVKIIQFRNEDTGRFETKKRVCSLTQYVIRKLVSVNIFDDKAENLEKFETNIGLQLKNKHLQNMLECRID